MRISLLLWVHAAFSAWLLPRCSSIYVPDNVDPPAFCTVFGHIMKSGGSTVKWALDSAQPEQQRQPGLCVLGVYAQDRCNAVAKNNAVIEGCGELARRALTASGRENCDFFTMMRHPIDRLISQFFYCPRDHDIQGRPPKWCGMRGVEEDLPARLLEFAAQSWGNHAWRMMMFGVTCPPQPGEVCGAEAQPSFQLRTSEDWKHLEVAEKILSTYTAVGILEHWSLSMSLFDARVKSPVRRWADMTLRVNKGVQSSRREWLHQWALNSTEIRSIVQGDLVLYEHAVSIFRSQTADTIGTTWGDM